MYYEVYADSLFLLHFFLNFYLLELVNHMLYKAMSHKRILLGASLGAVCSMVPFLFPLKMWMSMLCSLCLSLIVLIIFTFRVYKRELFIRILEKMIVGTFLLGGLLVFLIRTLSFGDDNGLGIIGILALSGICYAVAEALLRKKQRKENICVVTLQGEDTITVKALLDTGNNLIEPISGKPVSVLAKNIFKDLYKSQTPKCFRLIPYRSINNQKGMLSGYLLDSIVIEMEGVKKEYQEVYVGISQDMVFKKSTYQMILNPRILE